MPSAPQLATDAVRVKFWSLVDSSAGPDQCWPWLGPLDREGRYGQFRQFRPTRQAHRVALMLTRNVVLPKEIIVHHTCHDRPGHTPLCCNPKHLDVMGDEEHRSMHARQRWAADKSKKKSFRRPAGMGVRKRS
jgi:hypothetical protein